MPYLLFLWQNLVPSRFSINIFSYYFNECNKNEVQQLMQTMLGINLSRALPSWWTDFLGMSSSPTLQKLVEEDWECWVFSSLRDSVLFCFLCKNWYLWNISISFRRLKCMANKAFCKIYFSVWRISMISFENTVYFLLEPLNWKLYIFCLSVLF